MVLGMRYDSSFNYVMAGIYRTAVAVSALIISLSVSAVYAADPPVSRSNVSVNLNPTTSYYTATNSTLRLPNGVSTAPTSGVPVVSKYSGGLQQTIPTGITIDAIKKSAPLPVVVRAKTQSLKNAAKGVLGSPKANLAFLAASAGFQQLLNGLDWVMGEGGQIQKKEPLADIDPAFSHYYIDWGGLVSVGSTPELACDGMTQFRVAQGWVHSAVFVPPARCNFKVSSSSYGMSIYKSGSGCPAGSELSNGVCVSHLPVSVHEIDEAVDSSYNPDPSDWRSLTPYLQPDDIEITSAPTLQGEPKTTTVFDAEGNPHKVTQTNIWYDFDIRDNPSPRPTLDLKTREETETYENGELTGTTTTESTASGGSGITPEPPPDSLIDCDLFPTACAWFDWTQEEPIEPDDDLSGLLQEVPIVSETYTITGGAAVCPAPMVLDLSVFGSREVSYQPLCDLASTMKYLYLALMSFAAAVLLNRSVNRV